MTSLASITVALLAGSTIVWGLAVFIVPQHVNSLFRYRLWKLRDNLQDHILEDRLPESPAVRDLMEGLEAMIQHSDQLTFSRFLVHRIFRKQLRAAMKDSSLDLCDLSDSQKALFIYAVHESYESALFKAIAGSPLGALTFPFWLFWFNHFTAGRPSTKPQRELRRLREFRVTLRKDGRDTEELLASVG